MSTLDVARAELGLAVLYLNKAEARDKICRAIQYGSKYLSNREPGTAQNVDKSTSLARKVFRLFKFVNDLHALISPTSPGTPLPLSKNALLSTFLFLDQIVWLSRTGIYKNKERAELIGRISLYCWMGSSICTTLVELEGMDLKYRIHRMHCRFTNVMKLGLVESFSTGLHYKLNTGDISGETVVTSIAERLSERSNDMFCDDIFGESPAGVRKTGTIPKPQSPTFRLGMVNER
ncbi:hypothetical protein HYC85_017707 [Camellia sinensis]|uniref:Uncharacterized protein n=1 Tax=Camellia sinensis TaxID=4442 RepID=A0A7J7GSE8_CAMSI|nr:hypothetical protein HYC85_017707 [Camellia sinensis]